jgi:coproporphyrinogen III oxidase-like Fe-S oxidoreductase
MTIIIDEPNLLKKIEKIAKRENTTEEKILTKFIIEGLKKTEKETIEEKIERLGEGKIKIMKKPEFPKDVKKLSIDEMIGRYNPKNPFDPVKVRRDIHDMEY